MPVSETPPLASWLSVGVVVLGFSAVALGPFAAVLGTSAVFLEGRNLAFPRDWPRERMGRSGIAPGIPYTS